MVRNLLLGALVVSGVYLSTKAYAQDNAEKVYTKKEKRAIKKRGIEAELLSNLKSIQTAEIVYDSNFDVFVSAEQYPATPNEKGHTWVKDEAGGFATMGWSPDGKVRGSYAVTISRVDFTVDFTVVGIGDIDGDGTLETYRATKSTNPTTRVK